MTISCYFLAVYNEMRILLVDALSAGVRLGSCEVKGRFRLNLNCTRRDASQVRARRVPVRFRLDSAGPDMSHCYSMRLNPQPPSSPAAQKTMHSLVSNFASDAIREEIPCDAVSAHQ